MHDSSGRFASEVPLSAKNRLLRLRVGLLTLAWLCLAGCAEMQAQMEAAGIDLGDVLVAGAPLDASTVATGLKQALEVGTRRTTTTLSRPGAFGNDPVLRLSLPGELGRVAEVLRGVGFGAQVDALEDSMNRAAEEAAAQAVPVFTSAITQMTIADAFEILNGADDAATQYFQERTSETLRARFRPVATRAMQEVGLYGLYTEIVERYDQIPFTKPPAVDLEGYVADQTLTALFAEIAREEGRIREDPAARSTALLRRVFGAAGTPEGRGPGAM